MEREYCPANPPARIQRPILDDNAPGILTPVQAEALLQTAKECLPEMVAPVAIGLFAGLRRSELCALDWSEIDLAAAHIEVKGIKAKTRQRRLVTISDNLAEWLRPYSQGSGPVAFNVDLFGEKLRHLVQGRPKTNYDPGRLAIIAEWPHNALRHSFGSYLFAKCENENLTAAEMGNSPAMVFKHYRALVIPHEYSINASNVEQLKGMSFVFLCIDAGDAKKLIIEKLEEWGISFIDVGMGIQIVNGSLTGQLQVTTSTPAQRGHVQEKIGFSGEKEPNDYDRNIQVADLNALNAILAVIRWKKLCGFYHDLAQEHSCIYAIGGNVLINEDKA
jgi:hypothetical protein